MAEQHPAPRAAAALAAYRVANTQVREVRATLSLPLDRGLAELAYERAMLGLVRAVDSELPALLERLEAAIRVVEAARELLARVHPLEGSRFIDERQLNGALAAYDQIAGGGGT